MTDTPLFRSRAALQRTQGLLQECVAAATFTPALRVYPHPDDFIIRGLQTRLILSAVCEHLSELIRDCAQNSHAICKDKLIASISAHLRDSADEFDAAMEAAAEELQEAGAFTRSAFWGRPS